MDNTFDKKKVFGMITGVAAFFISYYVVQQVFFKPPTIDKQLTKATSEINKNCPIMVDSQTKLDNTISLADNILQYNYTLVNLLKDSINVNELENSIKPNILNTIKTSPDLETFRNNDVTIAYNYKDKNGVHLFKITFKADQYK